MSLDRAPTLTEQDARDLAEAFELLDDGGEGIEQLVAQARARQELRLFRREIRALMDKYGDHNE